MASTVVRSKSCGLFCHSTFPLKSTLARSLSQHSTIACSYSTTQPITSQPSRQVAPTSVPNVRFSESLARSAPSRISFPRPLPRTRWLPPIQSTCHTRRFASTQPPKSGDNAETSGDPVSPSPTKASILPRLAIPVTTHENIYTIPNALTFSRLLAAPVVGYAIVTSQPYLALGLFIYAGLTDFIDGYLARRYSQQTVVGTVIDPMADKTLMTICVVCLSVTGHMPVYLAVVILGRDIGLAISAIYYRYISLPEPKTFRRYWDFSLPSAEVRPTEISKINTLLQLLLVGCEMVMPVLPLWLVVGGNLMGVLEGWEYLVAGTTVWSGLSYVFSKDAVRILGRKEGEEKQRRTREEGEQGGK